MAWGANPTGETEKWGGGRLAKAVPSSDILSLTASPRWELLGIRCGSGRVLELSIHHLEGAET